MQTRTDMETELVSRLQVASNSTVYPASRITQLIKDAHLWATALHPFTELQRAKWINSTINKDYYDYPQDFRTDTLAEILYVNNLPYTRIAFHDLLEYRRKNPNSTKRIFADWGRQYWLFPTPKAVMEILIFGQIQAADLVNGSDKTIFSMSDDQGNEAIVKKALSVAVKRANASLAQTEEQDAIAILTKIFADQKDRQQREQRLDRPYFDVPDFFGGAITGSRPGGFNYNPDE